MRNFFNGLIYKWLALTFLYIIAFRVLDYILGVSIVFSFFDVGLFAFIILWCEQQDKLKKEGE